MNTANTGINNSSSMFQSLARLGWTEHFQKHFELLSNDNTAPARVVGVRRNRFNVSRGEKVWMATVSGRLIHHVNDLYPVTGDWVLLSDTVITRVLPRKNVLSRGAAGSAGTNNGLPTREQMIAANIDTVFIVCGLDRDFNLRRIERYLTLVYNCGLNPVIVLTKEDLCPESEQFAEKVESVAYGVPLHLVSVLDDNGLTCLEQYLSHGQTVTMIGSSGAGKSTLVNRLSGKEVQVTATVSESVGKGRHTTTTRDLIMMPQGGMIIDNPGIREIAFYDDDGGIDIAFPDIEELARECKFSDCSHMHEPGCRVIHAATSGEITPGRLESYRKMKRELAYVYQRRHKSADRVEKERWKGIALKIKAINKRKNR